MYIPMFSIIFLCSLIFLQVTLKKNGHKTKDIVDDFLKREMKANTTMRKKIDDDIFIYPNIKSLPIRDYPSKIEYKKLIVAQDKVIKKSELKMIHFLEPISNTDLKLKYGLNNLETITMYEEHYNSYIRALIDWAKLLIDNENLIDAEIVLNSAISFHSDLSMNYTLLADIYNKTNNREKLQKLKLNIEQSELKMKDKILNYIDNICA